jgi:hypothetical protein
MQIIITELTPGHWIVQQRSSEGSAISFRTAYASAQDAEVFAKQSFPGTPIEIAPFRASA